MRYLLLLAMLLLPSVVLAQAKPMGEKVSASGKIKAVGPGYIHVVSEAGDQWQVAFAPKAEVFVHGAANASFLRSGMPIKLSGKFNKKAETVEPLSSVTVFTPRDEKKRGRAEAGGDSAEASAFAKNLFKIEDPAQAKPAQEVKPPETFDVSTAGVIASARGNRLSVRVPGAVLKVELTDDAQVTLDIADYRVAREGDRVDLEGWTYRGDVTKVVANRVTITLAEPLGEKK
jgi:hypothetical protein